MSHSKDNCPFLPKDNPEHFDTYNLYNEYDGWCRDCDNKWTMVIQGDYIFNKDLVDVTKNRWYEHKRSKINNGD